MATVINVVNDDKFVRYDNWTLAERQSKYFSIRPLKRENEFSLPSSLDLADAMRNKQK